MVTEEQTPDKNPNSENSTSNEIAEETPKSESKPIKKRGIIIGGITVAVAGVTLAGVTIFNKLRGKKKENQ